MSARRPRVLLVIAQLDIGGAERQVVTLASGLGERGFDVDVAVFYKDGELEPQLRALGIPVHHLKRTSFHGLETILDLTRRLRALRPDIVHSFLWPANWRTRAAAALGGVPVIISSSRSVETWLRWYHVAIDRLLALRTDTIVVNATAIATFLQDREGLRPELFTVIPNGLDLTPLESAPSRVEARARLGLSLADPMVLTVGNLQPEKNHEDFLAVAARLKERRGSARFVIVGDGPRRQALHERAQVLGLDGHVLWMGRRTDVPVFLAASDVFMNTSRREGCCNAILEAMSVSRPVVAYSVGGNPELIEEGKSGRLIPFGELDQLSAAVESYLADPRLAADHGAFGSIRVRERFSRDAMIDRTASLYRALFARKGLPVS